MKVELRDVLRRPIVTEATNALKQAANQVVFEVAKDATKDMIKVAVEKAFKVDVLAVNTMIVPSKAKRSFVGRKKVVTKKSNWKKAIVTIKQGQNIEVIEGV